MKRKPPKDVGRQTYCWTPYHIIRLRNHLRLTQKVFAKELGIRLFTIKKWEEGVTPPPMSYQTLLSFLANHSAYVLTEDEKQAIIVRKEKKNG